MAVPLLVAAGGALAASEAADAARRARSSDRAVRAVRVTGPLTEIEGGFSEQAKQPMGGLFSGETQAQHPYLRAVVGRSAEQSAIDAERSQSGLGLGVARSTGAAQTGARLQREGAQRLSRAQTGIEAQIARIRSAPSAGAAQLGLGVQQSAANTAAMAAGQRGNQAAALRNAAMANQGAFAAANQQAAVLRAQEQQAMLALEAQQRNQLAGLAGGQQQLGVQQQLGGLGIASQDQRALAGIDLASLQFDRGQQLAIEDAMLRAGLAERGLLQGDRQIDQQQQAAQMALIASVIGGLSK